MPDREELEDQGLDYDEFLSDVREQAGLYAFKAREVIQESSVTIYRAVSVPAALPASRALQIDCLGKAWSFEFNGAGVYNPIPSSWQKLPLQTLVVQGTVNPNTIDWAYGFSSFMHYGEDQWEASMLPNSEVYIQKIHVHNEGDLGQEREIVFDPPVIGNTGNSGEGWGDGCGAAKIKTINKMLGIKAK